MGPESDSFAERRVSLRRPLVIRQVRLEAASELFFGYATSLSLGGLFIHTVNPKRAGTKVQLRFNLPGDDHVIECPAEVAWTREYHPQTSPRPGMGVRFVGLSEEDTERIRVFTEKDPAGAKEDLDLSGL